jgi:ABC-2 type transport system permease protein
VSSAGSLAWFAQHECRLAWRDWLSMMTAGRRRRVRTVAIALALFAAFMHLVALGMVGRYAQVGTPDKLTLVVVSGSTLLSWALMLSQAMESVTRAFYARADLDLILSSPVAARRVFSVRIAAMAFSTIAMAMLLAAPFIDALILRGGWRWLGAYGVVAAMGATATALAVGLTVALFHVIGPKRTRLIAQIVAAVIGAVFVIGLQAGAILSYGSLSRIAFLESDTMIALAPAVDSLVWWPARAILGDVGALVAVLAASLVLLAGAILLFAPRFAHHAIAAASIAQSPTRQRRDRACFRAAAPAATLRRKEWTLLRRDPWLLSQTLMQVLYLLPPALLLWRNFSGGANSLVLLSPVLIMAAGQLAGGLAWLAISGEDAPDLIASAPVSPRQVLRAKIEAVLGAIALVFAPFVLVLSFPAPFGAFVSAVGIVAATASATAIQLWFRGQAKRSHFRRRQTSSRVATFAEALSSIGWAATGALAAAGSSLALVPGLFTLGILVGARLVSPGRGDH